MSPPGEVSARRVHDDARASRSSRPPGAAPSSGHPVQLSIVRSDRYSRGLAVLGLPVLYGRFIALIPVYVVLLVVGIAAFLTAWVLQFVVLFTGKYPEGATAS